MQKASWLHHDLQHLFNLLLPPACALCFNLLEPPDPDTLCQNCRRQIVPLMQPSCPRCALPYPAQTGPDHYCQTCLLERKPSFSGVTAVGSYDGLLRDAIHRFKYRNNIDLDRPLAAMLAKLLPASVSAYDLIVPIPLHPSKLRQRSFNQSALLARQLAKRLHGHLALNLLDRSKSTPAQQGLSARERLINIKDSFNMKKRLNGESILLVDDVMTTGATARECAKVLLKGGADTVHVAILARAPLR